MKRTDLQKYREMDSSTCKKELRSLRLKLAESKLKLHSGQIKDTSIFKKTKYQINFLLNLIHRHDNHQG